MKLPEAEMLLPENSSRNPAPACLLPQAENFSAAEFTSCLPPAWQLLPGPKQLPAWAISFLPGQGETRSSPP